MQPALCLAFAKGHIPFGQLARAALIPRGMRLNPKALGKGKFPLFFSKKQHEKHIFYAFDIQSVIRF
jgi:hypothetical protein